jgi:hypothetical protein
LAALEEAGKMAGGRSDTRIKNKAGPWPTAAAVTWHITASPEGALFPLGNGRWGMAVAHGRYKFVTVLLRSEAVAIGLFRFLNRRPLFQKRNHLDPEAV